MGRDDWYSRDEAGAAAHEADHTWPDDEPDPSEYMDLGGSRG